MLKLFTLALSLFTVSQIVLDLPYPAHFPQPTYDFSRNRLTSEKIQLGRALFYDPILAKDNTISCASCHSPYNAFAHTDHALSHGIDDQIGTRNAPPLFNLAWQKTFNRDGAIHHLDLQALAPLNDPREMGETTENVVEKLQKSDLYPALFQKAFGDSTVTGERLLKALAQFQLTLVSGGAKYDEVIAGKEIFTPQEESGYRLFRKNCNTCHTEPLFSTYDFAKNNLPPDTVLNDYGRGAITRQSSDSLAFKIPSLRNLSYTHPYMHDGRFKKLREVIRHYNTDFLPEKNTKLSPDEQTDLIAFLLTLNDRTFVFNKNHQYPRDILLRK